jgi:hypothetical protein
MGTTLGLAAGSSILGLVSAYNCVHAGDWIKGIQQLGGIVLLGLCVQEGSERLIQPWVRRLVFQHGMSLQVVALGMGYALGMGMVLPFGRG